MFNRDELRNELLHILGSDSDNTEKTELLLKLFDNCYKDKVATTEYSYHLKRIIGALKNTINAHGPITIDIVPSAAKRILGAIKL